MLRVEGEVELQAEPTVRQVRGEMSSILAKIVK